MQPPSFTAWKACNTVLHVAGVSSSIFRLARRYKSRSVWWDDYIIVVPLCAEIILCIVMWIPIRPALPSTTDKQREIQVALYWLTSIPYLLILWSSRMSLALSIARLFPSRSTPRRGAMAMVAVFALALFGLLCLTVITCTVNTEWRRVEFRAIGCNSNTQLGIAGISADMVADTALVVAPLLALWRITLPFAERRLILVVFSMSVWTLAIAVLFSILGFGELNFRPISKGMIMILMSHVEAAVAVMVCNASVIIIYALRLFRTIAVDSERTGAFSSAPMTSSKTATTSRDQMTLTEISSDMSSFSGAGKSFVNRPSSLSDGPSVASHPMEEIMQEYRGPLQADLELGER